MSKLVPDPTPGPPSDSDKGGEETGTEVNTDSENVDVTEHGDPTMDSSSFGESDSAGEMALISESFKRTTAAAPDLTAPSGTVGGLESTATSNQEATHLEVKSQVLAERGRESQRPSKMKKRKRASQMGVP